MVSIARKLLCVCVLLGSLAVVRPAAVLADGPCNCDAEGFCDNCGTYEYNLAICASNNQTQIDNVCHSACDAIQMSMREAWCADVDEIDCQCGNEEL